MPVPSPHLPIPPDATRIATHVRAQLPADGLFADQDWRVAPSPLILPPAVAREIESLGRVLLQFYRALQLLYRRSIEGKAPDWVATLLDQGKPPELIELQRHPSQRNELPRVIRPDLLITDQGLAVTELDSVPGGIGLTAWLYQAYESAGLDPAGATLLGSSRAMLEGFAGIFGSARRVHILVSEESATYRPEMRWLAERLPARAAEVRDAGFDGWQEGDAIYRFFELFDLPQIPAARRLFEDARERRIHLTPPPKPLFEEKLALGLLWNRNLRPFWRQELGEAFLQRLQRLVPRTWILDPSPLPPHAAYPGLDLTDWGQLKDLSQRERDLILKVSGFSAQAWGARGVHLGSDLSGADWAAAVDAGLAAWPHSPHILQRYHKPEVIQAAWHDFASGTTLPMPGRVRLCPYYFVHGDADAARPHLGGVLATVCPADKKIIHGMRDAVLAPCAVGAPAGPKRE